MTRTDKPIFHVILGDRDQWVVEAEWPDGTLERVQVCQSHDSATVWVATQSETWLHIHRIFEVTTALKDQLQEPDSL
jgi:hypothetical protein